MGACGAGAAGSEIQPYLESGIEEAALSGGRRGGGCGDAGSGGPAYKGGAGLGARTICSSGCHCMLVANSALGFPDGLRWQNAGERRVLPEAMPFLSVGAEDLANRIDRSIQDRRPLGVAPKQGGATRILAGPLAEICASHLQGVARLAQARCYQLRQFDANRVVDSVRHGLVLGVLPALCQREVKN